MRMRRWLFLLLALFAASLHAADEITAAPSGKTGIDKVPADQPADEAKKPAPEPPPKKTEYDQLPLPQLLSKAKAGNAVAQFELASRFNYGRNMPRNTPEAVRWLRKAAIAGNPDAMRLLTVKLYNGYDVAPDLTEAMSWARLLADRGDMQAQMTLANMYANGEGAPRDLVQAYKWYAIAAVTDRHEPGKEPPSDEMLNQAAELRDKTGSLLTLEEETEAQQLASDWWMNKYAPQPKVAAKPKSGKAKKAPAKTTKQRRAKSTV